MGIIVFSLVWWGGITYNLVSSAQFGLSVVMIFNGMQDYSRYFTIVLQ